MTHSRAFSIFRSCVTGCAREVLYSRVRSPFRDTPGVLLGSLMVNSRYRHLTRGMLQGAASYDSKCMFVFSEAVRFIETRPLVPSSSTAAKEIGSEQQLESDRGAYSHPPSSIYFWKGLRKKPKKITKALSALEEEQSPIPALLMT